MKNKKMNLLTVFMLCALLVVMVGAGPAGAEDGAGKAAPTPVVSPAPPPASTADVSPPVTPTADAPAGAGEDEDAPEMPEGATEENLQRYHDEALKAKPPRVTMHPVHGYDSHFCPAGWTDGTTDPGGYSLAQSSSTLANNSYGRYEWRMRREERKAREEARDATGTPTTVEGLTPGAGAGPAAATSSRPAVYGKADAVVGVGLRGPKRWRNAPGSY